ncbi:mobilization protein [Methylosinus sp. RM1]|uniref:mobilization protein n=1 Tax=Methylosinus sp. RM1 TaxID=2583817 RepID=UPI00140D2912
MARKTIAERIARLDARKKALQARQGKQERADDTRRKVLLGALVLHRLENSGAQEFSKRLGDWLRRELPGFLTRDSDKVLFTELLGQTEEKVTAPPLQETEASSASASLGATTYAEDTTLAAKVSIA